MPTDAPGLKTSLTVPHHGLRGAFRWHGLRGERGPCGHQLLVGRQVGCLAPLTVAQWLRSLSMLAFFEVAGRWGMQISGTPLPL